MITLTGDRQCTGDRTAHVEMISVTWHFKWILVTLELTSRATGGGYKISTVVRYVLQLLICSYDLIMTIFVYFQLQMMPPYSFYV